MRNGRDASEVDDTEYIGGDWGLTENTIRKIEPFSRQMLSVSCETWRQYADYLELSRPNSFSDYIKDNRRKLIERSVIATFYAVMRILTGWRSNQIITAINYGQLSYLAVYVNSKRV